MDQVYDTIRTSKPNSSGGYIEVKLPSAVRPMGFMGNTSASTRMHKAVFYTFTKMEDTGEYKPSVDHINRKNVITTGLIFVQQLHREQIINQG